MATPTYTPIATVTASGSSVYLEATAIPSTYTDLIVVLNIKESGQDGLNIQMGNGSYDTGSNYSNTYVQGNGSSAGSGKATSQTYAEIGIESNEWGTTILHFQNYANTNVFKTILTRTNSTNFLMRGVVALWRSTSAIERIRIYNGSNANHAAGSTMTLYGISNANGDVTPKATGGIVTSDSTYYYHTFLGSNTFTPSQSLTVDCLVVAGGGGGGSSRGGGGGAGAFRTASAQTLSATAYPVLVGAGGAGGQPAQNSGTNSSFNGLTATGGGAGAAGDTGSTSGQNGGSGGGGFGLTVGVNTNYGTGTTGGNNGGNGYYDNNTYGRIGGGGGGAGAVGVNATGGGDAGAGGAGLNTYSTWASATSTGSSGYYAGGGGGGISSGGNTVGSGGLGGGGNGGKETVSIATNAIVNTGSGGGGGGGPAGNGGSGIVIVRYLKA